MRSSQSDAAPAVRITAQGRPLDPSPSALGELRCSAADDDPQVLRERLASDGYLFVRGLLGRERVLTARTALLAKLAAIHWVQLSDDSEPRPGPRAGSTTLPELAADCPELMEVLYAGPMINWYANVFGEPVRHFDFTWLRAFPPGPASRPHMDSVFMNRGSDRLLTSWTPLGDIDRELGGLAILAGSHRVDDLVNGYGSRDVDTYCVDEQGQPEVPQPGGEGWDGSISGDPVALQAERGLPWLTSDFQAGDVITFGLHTAHIGLDNNTDSIRLSCDSRYQPAAEPADPRWIGVNPSAHTARSKRGRIC